MVKVFENLNGRAVRAAFSNLISYWSSIGIGFAGRPHGDSSIGAGA